MKNTINGSFIPKEKLVKIRAQVQEECTCGQDTICWTCTKINDEAKKQGCRLIALGQNVFYAN